MKSFIKLLMVVMTLISIQTFAQVSGTVIDVDTNTPLEGATIYISESIHTVTDAKGIFNITDKTNTGTLLRIEFLGYAIQELKTNPGEEYNISLKYEQIVLEEISLISTNLIKRNIYKKESRRLSEPVNAGELFEEINGFSLVKRSNYAMEPVLRGFSQERINIQYDNGVKVIHACPNRMDPATNHVSPEDIESIEVIKGPFSVRYGSNFGGVVNIVTTKLVPTVGRKMTGGVNFGIESNGFATIGNAKVGISDKKFSLQINGGYKNYGDYKDGNGVVIPSSFNSVDYATKVAFFPTKNQKIQLNWRQSFDKGIMHAALPMDSDFDNSTLASLDYKIQNIGSTLKTISAKLFTSYVDHLMSNTLRPSFKMMDVESPVTSLTYGGKVEGTLAFGRDVLIFMGVDYSDIVRQGSRHRLIKKNMMGIDLDPYVLKVDPIWQDSHVENLGVFVESTKDVNSKLSVTLGARLDLFTANTESPANDFIALYSDLNTRHDMNVSGNISMKYYHSSKVMTQLSLGRGVRSPNMEELFINHFTIGSDAFEYVGNPFLNPEINHQIELTNRLSWKSIQFETSIFYSQLTDLISSKVDMDIARKYAGSMDSSAPLFKRFAKRYINIEDAMRVGGEVAFGVEIINGLDFKTQLAYTYTKNVSDNEPLPQTPPMILDASLNYAKDWYWVGASMKYNASQKDVVASFGEVESPDFTVINLRLGIEPIDNLTIGLAINNVFDVAYYDHLNFSYKNQADLSGVMYNAGRNLTGLVRYKF